VIRRTYRREIVDTLATALVNTGVPDDVIVRGSVDGLMLAYQLPSGAIDGIVPRGFVGLEPGEYFAVIDAVLSSPEPARQTGDESVPRRYTQTYDVMLMLAQKQGLVEVSVLKAQDALTEKLLAALDATFKTFEDTPGSIEGVKFLSAEWTGWGSPFTELLTELQATRVLHAAVTGQLKLVEVTR
jgi:hypothetical protein